jgi:hypothetical protein
MVNKMLNKIKEYFESVYVNDLINGKNFRNTLIFIFLNVNVLYYYYFNISNILTTLLVILLTITTLLITSSYKTKSWKNFEALSPLKIVQYILNNVNDNKIKIKNVETNIIYILNMKMHIIIVSFFIVGIWTFNFITYMIDYNEYIKITMLLLMISFTYLLLFNIYLDYSDRKVLIYVNDIINEIENVENSEEIIYNKNN